MSPPKHPYDRCRDADCERAACRAWKEALEEGYQDGYRDGYAEGFPAGQAACPLAHS